MSSQTHDFGTADGHNPEIIYTFLGTDEWYNEFLTYNQLDKHLRQAGVSENQKRLNDMGPDPEEDLSKRMNILEHLEKRNSRDLENLTKVILERDFFNGVPPLVHANEVVSKMKHDDHIRHVFRKPEADRLAILRQNDVKMPTGIFWSPRVIHEWGNVSTSLPDILILPHIHLPGWEGKADDDIESARQWQRGIDLAEGRFTMRHVPLTAIHDELPLPHEVIKNLGFPTAACFDAFIHSDSVKSIFRELWTDGPPSLRGQNSDGTPAAVFDEHLLPTTPYALRPVALRVLYSRAVTDDYEYNEESPDKSDWTLYCHLARFCLRLEHVCHDFHMPPLYGQIPNRPGRLSASRVTWAGVELARVLRHMQNGFVHGTRYLDQVPSEQMPPLTENQDKRRHEHWYDAYQITFYMGKKR